MKKLSVIGIIAIFLAIVPLYPVAADTPLDFPIPNGYFYKQANGQGGAGDTGFAVTDDGGIPFWTWFQAYGGVSNVGYPVSQRFVWKNFIVQAFQKVVFQWRPESNSVAFVNVFDELSAAGKDDWLLSARSVPKAADWSSDQGMSWDQVVENHLALLDQNPAIKQVYFSVSDPVAMNGLPMAAQDFGTVFVVRAQRKVFQQWKQAMPWAQAGEVTVANGGDVGKEAGLYPPEAIVPTTWPPSAPPSTCAGAPSVAFFTASPNTITAGSATTLSWGAVVNADAVTVDNGIGGVATPGSVSVSPAATTTYRLTATGCGVTVTAEATVVVNAALTVPTPTQASPADGAVMRVYPRVATFTWNPVSVPGGVTYGIEIEINTGSWQSFANTSGLAGTTYNMLAFSGDNQGRWRVWATSPTYSDSAKSGWRAFSFNTKASQYSSTWLNDDPNTDGITKIIITSAGPTLSVHPYGKCHPTDCDWGTKSAAFSGEPFNMTFGSHQISITLNDAAGNQLKVVDTAASTHTYYFHRS